MVSSIEKRERFFVYCAKTLDVVLTAVAFVGAYFIKKYLLPAPYGGLSIAPNYYLILLIVVVSYLFVSDWFSLHDLKINGTLHSQVIAILKTVFFLVMITALALYFFKLEQVSRLMMTIFFTLNVLLLLISRVLTVSAVESYRARGIGVTNLLIIGSKQRAIEFIRGVQRNPNAGAYHVLGCLDKEGDAIGKEVFDGVNVIGTLDQLMDIALNTNTDIVVFTMPLKEIEDATEVMNGLEVIGVKTYIVPDWYIHTLMYEPTIAEITIEPFFETYAVTLHTTSRSVVQLGLKTIIDYILAGVTVVLLSPLFVFIALAIVICSPGPVFFKQVRLGLRGREFAMFKFRSMVPNAERLQQELKDMNEADGPVFKIAHDPRIIPYVGNLLRRTSLDELPQLINILRGEMSIVGPRPPVPAEVSLYTPAQRRRLSMKPGLTCLWQVSPNRNKLSFDEWMQLDLKYIDNWSLFLDFKIILRTFKVVLFGYGR
jgi:exopolysaccharide biosynthesis polyprenyl glycosylphosphotransferase